MCFQGMSISDIVMAAATVVMAIATCCMVRFNKELTRHSKKTWVIEQMSQRMEKESEYYKIAQTAKCEIAKILSFYGNGIGNGQPIRTTSPINTQCLRRCFDPNDRYPESHICRETMNASQQHIIITPADCLAISRDMHAIENNNPMETRSRALYDRVLAALEEYVANTVNNINTNQNAMDDILERELRNINEGML